MQERVLAKPSGVVGHCLAEPEIGMLLAPGHVVECGAVHDCIGRFADDERVHGSRIGEVGLLSPDPNTRFAGLFEREHDVRPQLSV